VDGRRGDFLLFNFYIWDFNLLNHISFSLFSVIKIPN
jgi:hypothetical protein